MGCHSERSEESAFSIHPKELQTLRSAQGDSKGLSMTGLTQHVSPTVTQYPGQLKPAGPWRRGPSPSAARFVPHRALFCRAAGIAGHGRRGSDSWRRMDAQDSGFMSERGNPRQLFADIGEDRSEIRSALQPEAPIEEKEVRSLGPAQVDDRVAPRYCKPFPKRRRSVSP